MAGQITPYGRKQILGLAFMSDVYTTPAGLWVTYTRAVPVDNASGSMLDEPTAGFTRAGVGAVTSASWDVTDFGEIYNVDVVDFAAATANLGLLLGWAVVDSAGIGTGNCWAVGPLSEPFTCDNGETPQSVDIADLVFGLYD